MDSEDKNRFNVKELEISKKIGRELTLKLIEMLREEKIEDIDDNWELTLSFMVLSFVYVMGKLHRITEDMCLNSFIISLKELHKKLNDKGV